MARSCDTNNSWFNIQEAGAPLDWRLPGLWYQVFPLPPGCSNRESSLVGKGRKSEVYTEGTKEVNCKRRASRLTIFDVSNFLVSITG